MEHSFNNDLEGFQTRLIIRKGTGIVASDALPTTIDFPSTVDDLHYFTLPISPGRPVFDQAHRDHILGIISEILKFRLHLPSPMSESLLLTEVL